MKTIKMLLIGTIFVTGISAKAIVFEMHNTDCTAEHKNALTCTITSTTLFPVFVVDATNYDLNDSTTQAQLVNESSGATELRLIPALAEKLSVDTETLREAIYKIASNGLSITPEQLNKELAE